jgi:anti-anti-sigma factor
VLDFISHDMSVLSWSGSFGSYVKVVGDIDVCSAPGLRAYLAEVAGAVSSELIVGLGARPVFGSDALRVLIATRRRLPPHGHIRLVTTSSLVPKVLGATQLSGLFPVHRTLREAIASIKAVTS